MMRLAVTLVVGVAVMSSLGAWLGLEMRARAPAEVSVGQFMMFRIECDAPRELEACLRAVELSAAPIDLQRWQEQAARADRAFILKINRNGETILAIPIKAGR